MLDERAFERRHSGVAPTLEAVVELYNTKKGLNLTSQQKADLVQCLKTL